MISWPEGAAKPDMHHSHEDKWRGTGWGAFWGILFGGLFFVPLLGRRRRCGRGRDQQGGGRGRHRRRPAGHDPRADHPGHVAAVRRDREGDLDRLGERMHGLHSTLVATNLTEAERSVLMETFG